MEPLSHTFFIHALIVSILLASLHIFVPRLRRLRFLPDHCMASFGGGVAVSYVFLHLLPELADSHEMMGKILTQTFGENPLTKLGIFLISLIGFHIYFGLEMLARSSQKKKEETANFVFFLHLFFMCVINMIITYSLPLQFSTGISFGILYTVAMALHFFLIDRGLEENYPHRYDHRGRYILAGAVLLGWVLSWFTKAENSLIASLLSAFLAGSLLFNVFHNELSLKRDSSFKWFSISLIGYGSILIAATWLTKG